MTKAVLLINIGTPASTEPAAVRRYLKEFLQDPRVVDLPYAMRKVLVNGVILPMRYKKTAAAYQQIWTENGSPLLHHSQTFKRHLAHQLGPDYQVELGMRYGEPSIAQALDKLKGASNLQVIPLFPQYSSAATGSALQVVLQKIAKDWNIPTVSMQADFYDDPGFIASYAAQIRHHTQHHSIDFLVFSYHGLPERHINKSHCKASCDRVNACPPVGEANRFCYRAQCYATTKALVNHLGLNENQYAVSFQSRLGRTPWIKPYTDLLLPKLIEKGVKNIAMVSPSFVADCLETLEEINIRTREQWRKLGGNHFTFIPCLNDSALWVSSVAAMIRRGC